MRTVHVIALLLFIGGISDLTAQDLVVANARVIDGTGNVVERGSIVIRDGRIVSVTRGDASAPGARVVDAKGMTALPGFIDAHRHIMGGNDERWFKERTGAG